MQCFDIFCVLFHHCTFLAENGMHVLWLCTIFQKYFCQWYRTALLASLWIGPIETELAELTVKHSWEVLLSLTTSKPEVEKTKLFSIWTQKQNYTLEFTSIIKNVGWKMVQSRRIHLKFLSIFAQCLPYLLLSEWQELKQNIHIEVTVHPSKY